MISDGTAGAAAGVEIRVYTIENISHLKKSNQTQKIYFSYDSHQSSAYLLNSIFTVALPVTPQDPSTQVFDGEGPLHDLIDISEFF